MESLADPNHATGCVRLTWRGSNVAPIVAGDMPAKTTYTDSHEVDAVANSQEWGRGVWTGSVWIRHDSTFLQHHLLTAVGEPGEWEVFNVICLHIFRRYHPHGGLYQRSAKQHSSSKLQRCGYILIWLSNPRGDVCFVF